jgi:hypothetical protein
VLHSSLEQAFAKVKSGFLSVQSIRHPLTVSADFRISPAVVLVNGFVHIDRDRKKIELGSGKTGSHFIAVTQAMGLLDSLKINALKSLRDSVQATLLAKTLYAVRIYRDGQTYLTFYGRKENEEISFYPFVDLTDSNVSNVRIPMQALPYIVRHDGLSKEQEKMLDRFFDKN